MEQQVLRAAPKTSQDPTEVMSLIKKIENLLRELSSTPSAARPSADNVPTTLVSQRQHAVLATGFPNPERGRAGKFTGPARSFPKFGHKRKRVSSRKKRTSFTDLPGELRNIVYEYALVLDRPIDLWPKGRPGDENNCFRKKRTQNLRQIRKRLAVGLLRVSRLIGSEAASIFYGLNAFRFSQEGGWIVLEALLYTIGPINRKSITDITVNYSAKVGNSLLSSLKRGWMLGELRKMGLHIPCYDPQVHKYCRNAPGLEEGWEMWAQEDTMLALGKDGTLKNFSLL